MKWRKCELVNVTTKRFNICAETPDFRDCGIRRAAGVHIAEHDIPHLIVRRLAVQDMAIPRVTIDVEHRGAPTCFKRWNFSRPASLGHFIACRKFTIGEDRRNGVLIDLLPAGKVLKRGCKVPFPQLGKVSETTSNCKTGGSHRAQA